MSLPDKNMPASQVPQSQSTNDFAQHLSASRMSSTSPWTSLWVVADDEPPSAPVPAVSTTTFIRENTSDSQSEIWRAR